MAVFCLGYAKLLWTNRFVRQQELVDEEKRIKVEELRKSGQVIEPRKSRDIPFGVRAIQSGIQIDGIWISKERLPIPTTFQSGLHQSSSDSSITSLKLPPPASLENSPDAIRALTTPPRSFSKITERESSHFDPPRIEEVKSTENQDLTGYRPSYKPRRSSHLRYGSHGDGHLDEETLEQLEGVPMLGRKENSSNTDIAMHLDDAGESPSRDAAENGHSPNLDWVVKAMTTSQSQPNQFRQSLPTQNLSKRSSMTNMALNRSSRVSLPSQASSLEYFSVPASPSEIEKSNTLSTPLPSPLLAPLSLKPLYAQTPRELTSSGESQVPLLSLSRPLSPFIPGELHMNKSTRKVNSGFEILPAGTFCDPVDFRGKGNSRSGRWAE
jgi:hypothetical protein